MSQEDDPSMGSSPEAVEYIHQDQDAGVENTKYDVDGITWKRGDKIGQGAFGSVYLATLKEPELQPLSPLPPQMAVKSAELFVSSSLQMEKQILSILHAINKSPYIIQCYGDEYTTGDNGENVYNLLLEYASGGSLRHLIKKSCGSGLPESDVRLYARSILRGIKRVHDRGLVHVDIKPDNILLVPCGSSGTDSTKFMAKICDFGLAKWANRGKSPVRGTMMYLSPEAVIDGIQEAPSDIWAIGCVVLELLTGKKVWVRNQHGCSEEIVYKIGFGMPKIPSGISEEGKEFLRGCFVRKAAGRLTVEMLLKLPFVSDLDEGDDEIKADGDTLKEENLGTQMSKNCSNSNIVPNTEIEEHPSMCPRDENPTIRICFVEDAEVDPTVYNCDGHDDSYLIESSEDEPISVSTYLKTVININEKGRIAFDEDLSMRSRDEDPSIKIYFDEHGNVVSNPDESKGSPKHDISWLMKPMEDGFGLIEPMEDEPSIVYLGTITNNEKVRLSTDERINNEIEEDLPIMCSRNEDLSIVYLRTVTDHEKVRQSTNERINNEIEEDLPIMCSRNEDFGMNAEVEPAEDEEKRSPRHGHPSLIEQKEDEPSIVFLKSVINLETWSPPTDEIINKPKRRKLT